MAWLTGWGFRKEITIQDTNIDGNLSDFPCYIDITADEDIGDEALATGYDIRFTEDDEETLLKYEREYWTGGNGDDATGHFWVKVPTILASGGATIYCYYGKAGASDGEDANNVWDANFVGIWHLSEGAGDAIDSSGEGNTGTYVGSLPNPVGGKIHNGQDCDGTGDWVLVGADSSFNVANVTVECWAKRDDFGTERGLVTTHYNNWAMDMGGSANLYGYVNDNAISSGSDISDTIFSYCVLTTTPGDTELFWDGGSVQQEASTAQTNSSTLYIGTNQWSTGDGFTGIIDEARVSDTVRTDEWIKFTHRNINEADNELTWGSEESGAVPEVFIPKIIMIT